MIRNKQLIFVLSSRIERLLETDADEFGSITISQLKSTYGDYEHNDVVRKHFKRQEDARRIVREADASRRVKDAIRSRVFPYMCIL